MAQSTRPTTPPSVGGDGFWLRALERLRDVADAAPEVIARGVNRVLKFVLRGTSLERALRELHPLVDRINAMEAETMGLHDRELRARTDAFRRRVQEEGESLDDILPEAFAVAREAADRRIGMCNVFREEHGFDPASFRHRKHRELYEQCRRRLEDGARLGELMLPASFYAELRDLYPDFRPPFRMRPFDVQLIGGIVLHQGKIAEMVTGEGKTLVATLPAYLNTLGGGHVHIVTVNDYLARRDRDWNAPLFEALGLTVGAIQNEMDSRQRQPEYACDITYGTNDQFGFDYLRDNMKDRLEDQVQGELQFAIVDEVDNILIDEARTPLIISGPAEESSERYYIANRLVNQLAGVNAQRLPRDEVQREKTLQNYDYTYNIKDHSVALTDRGIKAAERFLGVDNLYHGRNMDWPPYIEAGLKAKELYKLDVDYVVRDGEVIIVDEFTGRLQPGRRWADGLHQAVEAKEARRGAHIKEENQTLGTITYQNFFRLYDKLAGMTGTALTEAAEFMKIYGLDVMPIPTNRPLRRTEYHDLIYGTEKEKWGAIVDEILAIHKIGHPVLVGTISIEKSEKLSSMLERRGIQHEVLNAKHHEREAGIVSLAGQFGAVTVATNMAGRGTDITLGQKPWREVLAHWKQWGLAARNLDPNLPREELQRRLERYWFDAWGLRKKNEDGLSDEEIHQRLLGYWETRDMRPLALAPDVASLGGLHIVGTERHEARRIDNQLRGRAGRQGDPGSSRFFVSLEDDLMKVFMAQWVRRFMIRAGLSEGQPIESGMVSRAIERAQKKVVEFNFEMRKNVLEYDEVMNEQRTLIYDQRQEVLEGGERRDPGEIIRRALDRYLEPDLQPPSDELPRRLFRLLARAAQALDVELTFDQWQEADREGLARLLAEKAQAAHPQGLGRPQAEAWAAQLLADCRDDAQPCPQSWHLPRIARWARRRDLEVSREELDELVRSRLAEAIAQAASDQLAGQDLESLLRSWFTRGYEQDLDLLSRALRWDLESFRRWLGAVGVELEIVEWTPANSTCQALLPRWLEAAGEKFAGQPAAQVATQLALAAARLYLASPGFLARPEAARLAFWAERRLGLDLRPADVEAAYDSAVAPALRDTLAEQLAERVEGLCPREAAALWGRGTADWHHEAHLRFQAHDVVGLATFLSGRLRLGISSLELGKRPAGQLEPWIRRQLDERGPLHDEGEHLEGLEDIVFHMVDGSIERMLDRALGDQAGAASPERGFAPLKSWAADVGLDITEAQWRAFDLRELRLHFLRQAAAAYPAQSPQELAETFVPRFIRQAVGQFLASAAFADQPSYATLATWAVARFPFLPRDAQVESQLKRFAHDRLAEARQQLVEAKLQDLQQEGAQTDEAVEDLVPTTLNVYRAFNESDEVDLPGLAAFARSVFDVSVQMSRFEEDCQGDEREAVHILAGLAKSRYARKGLDKLVADAVDGVLALCMPDDRFPSEWHCERMHEWLRATGLSVILGAEDLRDDTLADVRRYFEQAAVAGQAQRPAEVVRAELVTAALQVCLESTLAQEGRDFIGLANAMANKYGVQLEPLELSKMETGPLEETLRQHILRAYEARKQELGPQRMLWTVRQLLLQTIDVKWKDHLYNMDHLRGVIGFRGYGQKDPKVEYKREGYEMFDHMTRSIEDTVTDYLLKVDFDIGEEEARSVWQADSYIHEAAQAFKQQQRAAQAPMGDEQAVARPITATKEPGRNDPCPCGRKRSDGKPVKYKNCCGRSSKRAS